jgi:hypothetical protein
MNFQKEEFPNIIFKPYLLLVLLQLKKIDNKKCFYRICLFLNVLGNVVLLSDLCYCVEENTILKVFTCTEFSDI